MAGTKRSSNGEDSPTRARKAPKTRSEESTKAAKGSTKSGTGKGKKKAPAHSTFLTQALPIHVSFTHTPATVIEDEDNPTTSSDPGHIANATLLPAEFSTGSYGWKGARRITIELQGAEGGPKEKVQVMLNINATVVGSKDAENKAGENEKVNEEAKDTANAAEDVDE